MKIGLMPIPKLAPALVLWLLAAGCGRGPELTPGATPDQTGPRSTVELPTSVPEAPAPPPAAVDIQLPPASTDFPLDLTVIDAANLERLAPFRQLTAPELPDALAGASLAFPVPYRLELVGQLDDGQLIVWNLASAEISYRDQQSRAALRDGLNPALAVSSAFQGYLATAATISGVGEAQAIVVRAPDDTQEPFVLSGAGDDFDPQEVTGLAFSPDGHLLAAGLAAGERGMVKVWDVWDRDDLQLLHEIAFDRPVTAVQYTPDGSRLVAAAGDRLVYLHSESGIDMQRALYDFPIRGLAISPGGETLAVWSERSAAIETPALAEPLVVSAAGQIRRVGFSPDESLAVVAEGGLLRFWELSSGTELTSFRGPAEFLEVRIFDNGRVLATIDAQARVLLWGVRSGAELPQDRARITAANAEMLQLGATHYVPGGFEVEISANSDWLAVGSEQGVHLVGLPSLQLRRLLPRANEGLAEFDASADGDRLAWVAGQNLVSVWDVYADLLTDQINVVDERCCMQMVLGPSGSYLVTLADSVARLWDLSTGRELLMRADVQGIDLSPDGSRLALTAAYELKVTILDRDSGRELRQLTGFTTAAPFYFTRFSPDWSTMYWGSRAFIEFTDVESGKLGAGAPFSWGVFSPQGDRIAAVEDGWILQTVGQAHMIDVDSGETLAVFDHQEDAIVDALAISPDGGLVATATEFSTRLWDADSGAELATLPRGMEPVNGLSFSPDGRMLLIRATGGLFEFWVVPGESAATAGVIGAGTAGSVAELDALRLDEPATAAAFTPDGRSVAAATASGAIWYWDLMSGQSTQGARLHGDWVYDLAYAPDGLELASVSKDGTLRSWSGPQLERGSADPQAGELSAAAWLPNTERLATGGQDGTLRLWELPTLRPILTLQAHQAWLWDLAASPAGDLLASASADRTIKLWRVRIDPSGDPQLSLVRTLTGHTAAVWGVDFAPNGRRLASAAWDNTVRTWDAVSGEQQRLLQGHTDWVYDVAYSPDGTLLASASADGTIKLWSASTGQLLAELHAGDRIWSVDFSLDGRYLVSASDSGAVQLWGVLP